MGYKIPTQTIEAIVKQLEANNKHLASHPSTPAIKKLISGNQKQIAVIKEAAPFDLDLYETKTKKK